MLPLISKADEYYSLRNGKYLGADRAATTRLRLIEDSIFKRINDNYPESLAGAGRIIKIDQVQIQKDMQLVRDLSMKGKENQLYIILDLKEALITSLMSSPGTNSGAYFEYYPAPGLGANMPVGKDGRKMPFTIILAGVHGHPDSEQRFFMTLPTMSPDRDAVLAYNRQIPIYGIDAMSNTGLPGSRGRIHRANPDGSIDNNIGWTKGTNPSGFDIARDALQRWGKSGVPKM
ncbi:MAG: hypothetical protein J7497_00840 [Chitinophagaceae bacterium]|nr:hypothetical protein [Chitinophagaceae bacterium]